MSTVAAEARAEPSDAAERFAMVESEFHAVDLGIPLSGAIRHGIAVAQSNGDGYEPSPDELRLMVLADQGVIASDEFTPLLAFLLGRRTNG